MSDASPQSTASAVIVGLARDCARDLPAALRNLATMAACFPRAAFIFAENDSVDGTAALLRDFAAGRSDTRILTFAGLDKRLPQRTRRLAFLRNQCLAAIRSDARLRASDYLIVADLDEAIAEPLDRAAFRDALAKGRAIEGLGDRAAFRDALAFLAAAQGTRARRERP